MISSKQSFRFADTPVSLLFEEVSESRNFIHKELLRFQGYEELMSVANTNSELPGLFNSPRSNSIFLILDNHFIHTHNSICFIPDILLWVLLPLSRRNTKDSANYGQPLHPELIPNYSFHVGDDNPGHDMPGAGAVTTDPSQSVERGIHDNSNRPSNHVMVESLPGDVTEPNDTPVSSDMSSAESLEADGVHSAKKPHHG
ncbi:LOW QUALITY PROTEIN: hypothetical protein HID58_029683 [Brassica napus]|uniref:Uncharacterized protein n=1 Tax=Brassica napus TaxID=3708 RepID=A0ABQ8CDS3_BRANA|nr:LOW QUALITY PROTEIN: hypothetical protein HID58_029683 [Brassica napus]